VNRRFEQLRAAAGLDWLHLHDLRHAFATFLLDRREELRTVMELLGHSTIRMTADTYGHLLPSRPPMKSTNACATVVGRFSIGMCPAAGTRTRDVLGISAANRSA
jgi:hypothetical protein